MYMYTRCWFILVRTTGILKMYTRPLDLHVEGRILYTENERAVKVILPRSLIRIQGPCIREPQCVWVTLSSWALCREMLDIFDRKNASYWWINHPCYTLAMSESSCFGYGCWMVLDRRHFVQWSGKSHSRFNSDTASVWLVAGQRE